jgi:hypothetical protein
VVQVAKQHHFTVVAQRNDDGTMVFRCTCEDDTALIRYAWRDDVRETLCSQCEGVLAVEAFPASPEGSDHGCPNCGKPTKRIGPCRACAIDAWRASR